MRRRKTPAGGGESPNLTDRGGRYPCRGGLVCQGPSQAGGCLRATTGPPLEAVQTPDPITTPHPPGGIAEIPSPHLSSHTHVTTANEESGSYSSLTAEVTPQSVLTLLCPWTRKSQHTSDKGYTGVQHPSRKERSMTPQHSFCTPGMTIPPHCTKLCCKNPNTGRSRSWRLTTNVLARQSSMTCSERNHMADFVEQPYRANSGPYWAAPTAAHGPQPVRGLHPDHDLGTSRNTPGGATGH